MKRKQMFLAACLAGCICLTMGCGKTAAMEQDVREALSAPQIQIDRQNLEEYEQDTNRWLAHTEYDTLSVAGEGYEAAAEGVRLWSEARAKEIQKLSSEIAGYAAEDEAFLDAENTAYQYSIYQSLEAARVDSRVISILEMYSEYSGGAHGNYWYHGYTFDGKSGQLLELADILEDAGGFQEAAADYIIQKLEENHGEGLFPEYEDTVRDIWTRNEGPNWYLDAAGIMFLFNPYEVGPYAMGDVRVMLPYEEFAPYIKDEYETLSGPGIAKVPEDAVVSLFLNGQDDGANHLRIYQDMVEEYDEGPVYMELNDSVVEAWGYTYGWIEGAYVLTKEDGRTFFLLNMDAASDDFTMLVYEITDGTIRECDRVYGISFRNGTVNSESLTLQAYLDVLGTYATMMNYEIGEDGKLLQQEEFFQIVSDGSAWKTLTNVLEVPVTVDGKETMLPVGSRINITASNNEGTALFYNEDTGENGEIHYIRGDGTCAVYIDGVPDYEYFEMVPYAG